MAITKETKVDRIEVMEDGQLQIREAVIIKEDDVEVSRTFHRYVLDPGKGEDITDKDARVQAIAGIIWTNDVVSKREAALEKAPKIPKVGEDK